MVPLLSLICATLIARLIAAFNAPRRQAWRWALRWGVAALFTVTANAHFIWYREDLIRMVPPVFGVPSFWVTFTGIAELAGAIGFLLPATRRVASVCLLVLLVAVFPANVYAAIHQIPLGGEAATPLVPRLLEQLLYLFCVAYAGLFETASTHVATRSQHSA